ncbi:hypothetical protein AUEXF2481DRAFT_345091 [Aureobasidium subglaciale EXF-2481]|uniref:Uncharacterized protein n=1 Tax=Aureobasidium subglaciale (strain EXF-2481) TaxID=1043005 RepID=A0A074Y6N7_AURSE|nr:uncharacterized protein AUEXF2481DRAFT_345091 [Aureobasidium subglaciale EXF-2481]KEQ93448.1 hypothetical protein AUEXF2481DRAFT_345091 [Aureobasidium subglaciale EXF-2481]
MFDHCQARRLSTSIHITGTCCERLRGCIRLMGKMNMIDPRRKMANTFPNAPMTLVSTLHFRQIFDLNRQPSKAEVDGRLGPRLDHSNPKEVLRREATRDQLTSGALPPRSLLPHISCRSSQKRLDDVGGDHRSKRISKVADHPGGCRCP